MANNQPTAFSLHALLTMLGIPIAVILVGGVSTAFADTPHVSAITPSIGTTFNYYQPNMLQSPTRVRAFYYNTKRPSTAVPVVVNRNTTSNNKTMPVNPVTYPADVRNLQPFQTDTDEGAFKRVFTDSRISVEFGLFSYVAGARIRW